MIVYNKSEIKNILNMLASSDEDNKHIAYELINNADVKNMKPELILLYKFGKINNSIWSKKCEKAWSVIMKDIINSEPLTTPKCLTLLKNNNASIECIELFSELITLTMIEYFVALGYAVDTFELNVKFKK